MTSAWIGRYPEPDTAFEDSLRRIVGDDAVDRLDSLDDLLNAAFSGDKREAAVYRWVHAFPEGSVHWPAEFAAGLAQDLSHEALVRLLMGYVVRRSLVAFQASRVRSPVVGQVVVFRMGPLHCRPQCHARDGLALPRERGAEHYEWSLNCSHATCSCQATWIDARHMEVLRGVGVPLHSDLSRKTF